ncbi:MAG: response regulator [Reyranella sp.]|uniref:response regulator n=1 Tax=Reyranella sp. TaxID=1929291 RepID=UPI003D13FAEA
MLAFGGTLDQTELRFLVEKNADGIIVVDSDGVVLFANPAAVEIFGRPPQALVGSPIGIPFTTGDTTDIAIRRSDGRLAEAEIRVVDTVWNHQPARLASVRDISVRRAMEERLRHSAKMEAIGRLTAGIAHDFNNVLTVVLGNLESARRQVAPGQAALVDRLDNATRGAQRAAGLTGRLLAFARRQPLEPQPFDVNELVSGMSDLLRRTLDERVRVAATLGAGLWAVEADPAELEAALLNLAVNARDAMPEGGDLRIVTSNAGPYDATQAAALNLQPGAYVAIAVEDSGIGMSADVLRQALEPFFTTKGGQGTGLGLSQVYGFATQSGGTITLRSQPGRGTVARIYLPKADRPPIGRERAPSVVNLETPRARQGETILVVEDDEDVRRHTVGILFELGYTVLEAGDALQALRIIDRESAPGLLLTDLGLPGAIDGRALAERARSLHPSLGVLIMTAYAATSLVEDGRLVAGVDFLGKPFTREALATRVRELLDRREGSAEPGRVLLVEDEALVRMYAAQVLGDLGYIVDEAATFAEALASFGRLQETYTAAVIDVGLPDRPGDDLVSEIRARRPDMPILLTTGYADGLGHRPWSTDPFLQIVGKPFQSHHLQAALDRLGVRSPTSPAN